MTELTDKIESRGHWSITIRPNDFDENRVAYGELMRIVQNAAVRMRGWPVPYIDDRRDTIGEQDWVGQDIDAETVSHYEAWRFWTSGQFVQLRSISADWRVGAEKARIPEGFSAIIEVWEIDFFLTEVFELAARLSLSDAGADVMVVEATLEGLANRALVVGQRSRGEFVHPHRSRPPRQSYAVTLDREELVSESRREAAKMSQQFFFRFGWEPSISQILEHQRELIEERL